MFHSNCISPSATEAEVKIMKKAKYLVSLQTLEALNAQPIKAEYDSAVLEIVVELNDNNEVIGEFYNPVLLGLEEGIKPSNVEVIALGERHIRKYMQLKNMGLASYEAIVRIPR